MNDDWLRNGERDVSYGPTRWRQKLRYPLQLCSRDKGPFIRPFHHNRTTSPLHSQVYRYHEALASHVSPTVSALFMSHTQNQRTNHISIIQPKLHPSLVPIPRPMPTSPGLIRHMPATAACHMHVSSTIPLHLHRCTALPPPKVGESLIRPRPESGSHPATTSHFSSLPTVAHPM